MDGYIEAKCITGLLRDAEKQRVPHATCAAIGLTIKDENGNVTEETLAETAEMDRYLHQFAWTNGKCPGCQAQLAGHSLATSLFATFRWGIVHGEGECGSCGYPARAYHRPPTGPVESFTMILPYHPDNVQRKPHPCPKCGLEMQWLDEPANYEDRHGGEPYLDQPKFRGWACACGEHEEVPHE